MSRSLYAALILLGLIWGGSFLFIKVLLQHDLGLWTIVSLRSLYGLVFTVLAMLVLRKPFSFKLIPWGKIAIVSLVNMVFPWGWITFSETRLTSSMASVLNATTPIWTILIGLLFFRGVFTRIQWAGTLVAFAGIIVLLGINPVTIISADPVGVVCMLAATFCYGLGTQLFKRWLGGLSSYQTTFATLAGAAVGSGMIAIFTERAPDIMEPVVMGSLLGLGVFGAGIAYILFNYVVMKGSPEFATSVTYLIPVSAMIWGYTVLGERIGWNLFAGLFLILGGVFVANRKPGVNRGKQANIPA